MKIQLTGLDWVGSGGKMPTIMANWNINQRRLLWAASGILMWLFGGCSSPPDQGQTSGVAKGGFAIMAPAGDNRSSPSAFGQRVARTGVKLQTAQPNPADAAPGSPVPPSLPPIDVPGKTPAPATNSSTPLPAADPKASNEAARPGNKKPESQPASVVHPDANLEVQKEIIRTLNALTKAVENITTAGLESQKEIPRMLNTFTKAAESMTSADQEAWKEILRTLNAITNAIESMITAGLETQKENLRTLNAVTKTADEFKAAGKNQDKPKWEETKVWMQGIATGVAVLGLIATLSFTTVQFMAMKKQLKITEKRLLLDSLRSRFETIWRNDKVPIGQTTPDDDDFERLIKCVEKGDDKLVNLIKKWRKCEKEYQELIDPKAESKLESAKS